MSTSYLPSYKWPSQLRRYTNTAVSVHIVLSMVGAFSETFVYFPLFSLITTPILSTALDSFNFSSNIFFSLFQLFQNLFFLTLLFNSFTPVFRSDCEKFPSDRFNVKIKNGQMETKIISYVDVSAATQAQHETRFGSIYSALQLCQMDKGGPLTQSANHDLPASC